MRYFNEHLGIDELSIAATPSDWIIFVEAFGRVNNAEEYALTERISTALNIARKDPFVGPHHPAVLAKAVERFKKQMSLFYHALFVQRYRLERSRGLTKQEAYNFSMQIEVEEFGVPRNILEQQVSYILHIDDNSRLATNIFGNTNIEFGRLVEISNEIIVENIQSQLDGNKKSSLFICGLFHINAPEKVFTGAHKKSWTEIRSAVHD